MIDAEDDFKTTILNLFIQIREFQQKHSSTSFQHHKFYSNPDPLRLENDLPNSYYSHSQSAKCLRSQIYIKKKKTTQFFVFYVMILRYLQINLHQMIKMTIFMTKDNFSKKQTNRQTKNLAKNSRKGKHNFLQSHKKHKKSTSLVMGPTYPVKENISR